MGNWMQDPEQRKRMLEQIKQPQQIFNGPLQARTQFTPGAAGQPLNTATTNFDKFGQPAVPQPPAPLQGGPAPAQVGPSSPPLQGPAPNIVPTSQPLQPTQSRDVWDYLDRMPRSGSSGLLVPGAMQAAMAMKGQEQENMHKEFAEQQAAENRLAIAREKDPNSRSRLVEHALASPNPAASLRSLPDAIKIQAAAEAEGKALKPELAGAPGKSQSLDDMLRGLTAKEEARPQPIEYQNVLKQMFPGSDAHPTDPEGIAGGKFDLRAVGPTLAANERITNNPEALRTLAQKMVASGMGNVNEVRDALDKRMLLHALESQPGRNPAAIGGSSDDVKIGDVTIRPQRRTLRTFGVPTSSQKGYQLIDDNLPTDKESGNKVAPTFWDNVYGRSQFQDAMGTWTRGGRQEHEKAALALTKFRKALYEAQQAQQGK